MSTGVESWSAESFAEMSCYESVCGSEVIIDCRCGSSLDWLANLADQG